MVKNKKPTARPQWVYQILVNESKPDCYAGQQRMRKQQDQVVIHANKLTKQMAAVK